MKKSALITIIASATVIGGVAAGGTIAVANASKSHRLCPESDVCWEYGRNWLTGYSKVTSDTCVHSATLNGHYVQAKPGEVADASIFVGFSRAFAYWDCQPDTKQ